MTKPSSALSIVLLPAPFGPSSPTAPCANVAVTFLQRLVVAVDDGDAVERDDGVARLRPASLHGAQLRKSVVGVSTELVLAASQRSAEAQRVGLLAHERDHVGDVLIERKPELLGAAAQIVAVDARAKALSFIRLMTDEASRSRMLFDGRTSDAAVTKPDISSQA